MKRSAKARRSGILCCHFLRNLAFYQSWFEAEQPFKGEQFWITANSNFLDIAVLEWCKLFVDLKGKQHFSKSLDDPDEFRKSLFAVLGLTESQFSDYVGTFKAYRDKFIAHLDDENMMHIPDLKIAKKAAIYLYQRLLTQEVQNVTFSDAPPSAMEMYTSFLNDGLMAYKI